MGISGSFTIRWDKMGLDGINKHNFNTSSSLVFKLNNFFFSFSSINKKKIKLLLNLK